jgi:hypothetical protein
MQSEQVVPWNDYDPILVCGTSLGYESVGEGIFFENKKKQKKEMCIVIQAIGKNRTPGSFS